MSKKLNIEQTRFLCYLRDNHQGLGYLTRINRILNTGKYDNDDLFGVLAKWQDMLHETTAKKWYLISIYGTPTKYLK